MKTKDEPPKQGPELTGIHIDVVLMDSTHFIPPFSMMKTSVYYELYEMKFEHNRTHPFMSSMTISDTHRGFDLCVLNDDVKLFGLGATMRDSWWAARRVSEMISREFPSLNCKMELRLRVWDGHAATVLDPIVFQDFKPEENKNENE